MNEIKAPPKAIMMLAENVRAKVQCPWCAAQNVDEPGTLEAFEQIVGDVRVIHIWCTHDDDHTTCITGARETAFEGAPGLETRKPASSRKRASPSRADRPARSRAVRKTLSQAVRDTPPPAANDAPPATRVND